MRNYWVKILLGALGIFVIGMIGVSIVRSGIAKVHSVVEGDGPITIPLGLIPFVLSGERLGNLDQVTLHRETPSRVAGVELEVNLTDSLLAQGLAGCRLSANFEGENTDGNVNIRVARDEHAVFQCVPEDSTPANLLEYGVAVFHPGDVEVPLLIPADVVAELQSLDFADSVRAGAGDSLRELRIPNADSIRAEVARELGRADSIRSRSRLSRDSVHRFVDSIRAEARRRMAEDADSQ